MLGRVRNTTSTPTRRPRSGVGGKGSGKDAGKGAVKSLLEEWLKSGAKPHRDPHQSGPGQGECDGSMGTGEDGETWVGRKDRE